MIGASKRAAGKVIFVTGTDTGVGKTVLAALLVSHLRQQGSHTLAVKPFCCGDRDDVRLLQAAQSNELTLDEINPFYFRKPVAPYVAMQQLGREVLIGEVLRFIERVQSKCDSLVVEGCGGLLVPLGRDFTAVDVIQKLNCKIIIVGRNQLGTINHTLLTASTVERIGNATYKVVLMAVAKRDTSSKTNRQTLEKLLKQPVIEVSFLGENAGEIGVIKNNRKKVKKTLAQILA